MGITSMTKKVLNAGFRITSHFYVIYGDGAPIYVGYTNRTVRSRFAEHRRDKDFSQYNKVEVKELKDERLTFNFTWDYLETCTNADTVSRREAELVNQYRTQSSPYQLALGGGQTWASEKSFVKSNLNNPKFMGMSAGEVKRYLMSRKREHSWLHDFVGSMKPAEHVWLHNFVGDMIPQERLWVGHFISHMGSKEQIWLETFSNNMRPIFKLWLQDFVNSMKPQERVWLSNFVGHMKPQEQVWLSNFVNHMRPQEQVWLRNFVGNMKPQERVWLSNFVGHINLIR